ncbi:uncharacterized protein SI:CH211-106K21.5 [Latimeria chalumnae]|uniref:uncharacterized protein SI:CH211-106K21.5 n=1 Tax=Latimeria chalumnae TaxID=7897 RepID=UPI0003C12461|nr:PREDICTED: uncharacterized protein LOC102355407 [Latimeria chalumnae]|eukprot:XP_006006302.1 PREDICTED: uncharacterized protein LOC102355407 [Latimeria chalumnae]
MEGRIYAALGFWSPFWWWCLLEMSILASKGADASCECSGPVNFEIFQTRPQRDLCCLNLTGSAIGSLQWDIFREMKSLQVLDLSNCNLSDISGAADGPGSLEVLHLDHNRLTLLPDDFLEKASQLRIIHLENNRLRELPKTFLQASNQVKELYLDFNSLTSLPLSVLKTSLEALSLSNNSWDCTCSLFDHMDQNFPGNASANVVGMVCSTPGHLHGSLLQNVQRSEVCRSHGLTALFICLFLFLLLGLLLWYCCKKRSKAGLKIGKREKQLMTLDRNGSRGEAEHHSYLPYESSIPTLNDTNVLLKNQVMAKPSTALLGSSRDLYEEVEIKLGASEDSLAPNENFYQKRPSVSLEGAEATSIEKKPEEETLSVTEVLKDSADREKLYMSQSVDYYNLVPGIELEDSDHCEYENIDLS